MNNSEIMKYPCECECGREREIVIKPSGIFYGCRKCMAEEPYNGCEEADPYFDLTKAPKQFCDYCSKGIYLKDLRPIYAYKTNLYGYTIYVCDQCGFIRQEVDCWGNDHSVVIFPNQIIGVRNAQYKIMEYKQENGEFEQIENYGNKLCTCGSHMKAISAEESQELEYCFTVYECSDCDSICKVDFWKNAGETWIYTDGRIQRKLEKCNCPLTHVLYELHQEIGTNYKDKAIMLESSRHVVKHLEEYLTTLPPDSREIDHIKAIIERTKGEINELEKTAR